MEPRLNMKDVQQIYKKSYRTIERWIKHRGLPAFKIGKEFVFIQRDLERWEIKQKLGLSNDNLDTDIELYTANESFCGSASGRGLSLAVRKANRQ